MRNLAGILVVVALIGFVQVFAAQPVAADYYLPPPAEDFFVIAKSWKIDVPQGRWDAKLTVNRSKRSLSFAIDSMRLADKVDSNSICTGGRDEKMRAYLQKVSDEQNASPLFFELISMKKGEGCFVAGLWSFDKNKSFKRATEAGPELYGISATEFKQIKNASEFEQEIIKRSESNWQKIIARIPDTNN